MSGLNFKTSPNVVMTEMKHLFILFCYTKIIVALDWDWEVEVISEQSTDFIQVSYTYSSERYFLQGTQFVSGLMAHKSHFSNIICGGKA